MPKSRPAPMPNKKRERDRNAGFSEKPELAKVLRVDGLTKVAEATPSVGMLPTPKKHSEMRRIGGPKGLLKVLKVEPTNMYSRISPPCGLLNDFNPGIINRIRSSKQVFSVIQDFVRRDTIGNIDIPSKQEKRSGENDTIGCSNRSSGSDQLRLCSRGPSFHFCVKAEYDEEVGDLGIAVRRADNEDGKDELKPSLSSVTASENASSFVLDEVPASTARGFLFLVKVNATAASQWLQCLRHDIARRLKERGFKMQSIQNCLPLCSKNFQLTRKMISWLPKGLCSSDVDVHKAKWIDQFERMYKTLNEEANRLVGN
ncbi:Microtubule-actin cross-linking factor [Salix suchowensis]|nr:Microtubule-actin cross-linking factor [Salix suchowensis]